MSDTRQGAISETLAHEAAVLDRGEWYERLELAARDLFPSEAGFWDSRRMHWIREALIQLGSDPAPTVPRCADLDDLECPW